MNLRRIYWLGTIVFVTGCTAFGAVQMEKQFGQSVPRERVVESLAPDQDGAADQADPDADDFMAWLDDQ